MRFITFTLCIFLLFFDAHSQTGKLTFAIVTDTHIGRSQSVEAAINTVKDINNNPDIQFVLVTGDLSNNGAEEQLYKAKEILDQLNKKYYVIPGNHEDVWSPSGGTAFLRVFGTDRFQFEQDGYYFIGTDCGPVLRHGLAHVPKEHLIWMDSVLNKLKDKNRPVIFANHYPMDSRVDNSFEVVKILKKYNTQLIVCGHGHHNEKFNFSGIPGIMCRTNLPVKDRSGYNIVTISNGTVTFTEKNPKTDMLLPSWASVDLKFINKDSITVPWPDYGVNKQYNNVQVKWEYQYPYDISGGFTINEDVIYTGTFDGYLLALDKSSGKKLWSYFAGGRIFSTPGVTKDKIVFTSTTGYVYCLSKDGKLLWKFASPKPVVSSPLIKDDRVFVGFSDHSFRCLDLNNGNLIWDFNGVKGFIQTATLYNNMIYFGAWDSNIYALDQDSGKLKWKWSNNQSQAYSPAMVAPIAAKGRIFTVTPDYYVTCFDAETGNIIWRETKKDIPVWFSDGLSQDSTTIFVKTRNNRGAGISTIAPTMQVTLNTAIPVTNDSNPTVIPEKDGVAYFSSNNGLIIAVSKTTGKILWEHKLSSSSVNMIVPLSKNEIYASTNDGKVACLKIN